MDVGTGLPPRTGPVRMGAAAARTDVGKPTKPARARTGPLEDVAWTRFNPSLSLGGTKGRPGRLSRKRRGRGRGARKRAHKQTGRREMAGTTRRKTAGHVGSTAQVGGEKALDNRIPGNQRIRRNVLAEREVVRQPVGGPIESSEHHNDLLITNKRTQEMRAKTGHGLHEQ